MFMPRNQNEGQNHNIQIANNSFECIYLNVVFYGTRARNKNYIHEAVKIRLYSANAII
jgi:hypothetical protein